MSSANRARATIDEEQRHAVSRLHRQCKRWIVGEDDVGVSRRAIALVIAAPVGDRVAAVDLAEPDEMLAVHARG
jgi:hypothetical protein